MTTLNEVAYGHGHRGRDILWSNGSPLQRGIPLAESRQLSCKSFIAKGIDSSSIAGRIGHLLQVAPIESAAARIFFRCARISARGTPDRTLTTWGELEGANALEELRTLSAIIFDGYIHAQGAMYARGHAFLWERFGK
jgi:hypothetical protein